MQWINLNRSLDKSERT